MHLQVVSLERGVLRRDLLLGVDDGGLLFRKLLGAFKVGETV